MKITHIHCIGIKGVGMTPLAIIAKQAGITVTGCDVSEEFITDHALLTMDIPVFEGFDKNHLQGVDLVITTGAHGGFTNPEVVAAKNQGIMVLTQGEAVGEFMRGTVFGRTDMKGISVTGTHGKTTTSAMIATMLSENKQDCSYVIGTGSISSLPFPGHYGSGEYFVAEADEYATEPHSDKTPKFMWQKPSIAVITNVEFDHPDLYPTIADIELAYNKFINSLNDSSMLVACGDDQRILSLLASYKNRFITYGLNDSNDFSGHSVVYKKGSIHFNVRKKEKNMGMYVLNVMGVHNVVNALATIAVGDTIGLSIEEIQKGLAAFRGSKRRMEFKGIMDSGALLYDDYAHHPTEIRSTLAAFSASYPGFRKVVIFQPHTYSRTKKLFEEFSDSFSLADTVICIDIYASLREEVDYSINSELLSTKIAHHHASSLYLPTVSDVVQYMPQLHLDSNTLVITMGAGDVYKLSEMVPLNTE